MNFLCMNVGTGSTKKAKADDRKKGIADCLTANLPLVVFAQEFSWSSSMHSKRWGIRKVPEQYDNYGNTDASFIFDEDRTSFVRLDNKTAVINTYGRMKQKSQYFEAFFDLPRVCICLVEIKGCREKMLLASWHGVWKVRDSEKKDALTTLLTFVQRVKVDYGNVPLILAGDFNLDAGTVEGLLPNKSFRMLSVDDSKFEIILYTDDIQACWDVRSFTVIAQGGFPFDHAILQLSLSPTADLPKDICHVVGDTVKANCHQIGGIWFTKNLEKKCRWSPLRTLPVRKPYEDHLDISRLTMYNLTAKTLPLQVLCAYWRGAISINDHEDKHEYISLQTLKELLDLQLQKGDNPPGILLIGDAQLPLADCIGAFMKIFLEADYEFVTPDEDETTGFFIIDKRILNFLKYEKKTRPHYGCPDEHRILNLDMSL